MAEAPTESVRLHDGSLYLDAAICERYLDGVQSVALWQDGACVYLIPLTTAGTGGHLLKIRNARGDRVIHCPEFVQGLGFDLADELQRPVTWASERHALAFPVS